MILRVIRVYFSYLSLFFKQKCIQSIYVKPRCSIFSTKVFKKCRSRGALATHMKSILAFVKRAPAKKPAIVAIKEEPAPLQTKISFSKRKTLPSMNANKTNPKGNPKPIPRKAVRENLSPYVIPTSVIPSDADHKTPEYRIAIVKYYHRITQVYVKLTKIC